MKINSMKLTVVIILSVMISAMVAGLFMIEIPDGNQKVSYMVLGSLVMGFIRAIADLFHKGA